MLNKLSADECHLLLKTLWQHSFTGYALVAQDGRFMAANPALCRMLEFTETELKMRRVQDITDPEDVAADTEMAALVADGSYDSYDMTKGFLTKTRKYLLALLRFTGVRTNQKFICFLGEIAPVIKSPERDQLPDGMRESVRWRRFGSFIKNYWKEIVAVVGAAAYVAAEFIKALKR